ncbi:hypothetical protein PIB30_004587 [Stylosanthes scabra]|uniref:F-box domain-containing protein n=1 Tax=Stylosanthes scabra TaxID=79078 RepID=A0ABU6Z2V4_9FABA|nr:hypothetical protein [Stylosanthes scabra]
MSDFTSSTPLSFFFTNNNINNNNNKKKNNHTSSSSISNLCNDLLSQIFTRLPFRSTTICKCVSKNWLHLISSTYFIRLFMATQHECYGASLVFLSPHQLILTFPPDPLSDIDDDDDFEGDHHHHLNERILMSPEAFVKGTVCGCSMNVFLCSDNRYTSGYGYFLHDPLNKETFELPSIAARKECLHAIGFICDRFCNDTSENKDSAKRSNSLDPQNYFRVVRIKSFIVRQYEFEVDVWSSETGKWRNKSVRLTDGFAFAPHWSLSFAYDGGLYFMGRTSIFVYDPYSLRGETLNYPVGSDPMNIMSFGFLGACGGNLRISDIGHSDVKVWELVMNEHWELVHHVNFSGHLPNEFCADYYKRVGGFHPHDGEVVYLYSFSEGIYVANLGTRKFTYIPGYQKSDLSPFHLELPLWPSSSPEECD